MPFNSSDMIEYQAREEEAAKASRIPEDTYIMEITSDSGVGDLNGLPRLRISHKIVASKSGNSVGRFHNEFFGWFASETSDSPKPIEERTRNIRNMNKGKLHDYLKSLEDSPTSDQALGESFDEAIVSLGQLDDPEEVSEVMDAIASMLKGQLITATVKYSKDGNYVNLYANAFDESIGAADAVAV